MKICPICQWPFATHGELKVHMEVKHKAQQATPQPPAQGGEGADAEVELMRLIKLGKKVDAIYLHRRLYNSGLREASDAVDAMAENRPTYSQLEAELARLQAENDALRKLCGDAADILEGSGLFIQQELKAAAKDGGK